MPEYTIMTWAERQEDEAEERIAQAAWPAFMLEDPVANQYFWRLYQDFPHYQFMLYDGDQPIAIGNSIPFVWDGTPEGLPATGWDYVLVQGVKDLEAGNEPSALSAINIAIDREYVGRGISRQMVQAMRSIARRAGLGQMVAPVRPNQKPMYPLTPMERYVNWTHTDGEAPFDAWMRVHWRLGAQVVKVCPQSMTIPGTVAEWESWTGMRFPESGPYIIPGALTPVDIDRERDMGLYVEPNVWMRHNLDYDA